MIDKLLISEPPLQVLPTLVKTVGLNEAIVLQQLHYLLRQSLDVFDNHKWVCLSYDEWSAMHFPFWSAKTISRAIKTLVQQRLVNATAKHNRFVMDTTKWYTIQYDALEELANSSHPADQNATSDSDANHRTLLMQEPPLQVLPSLAKAIGLNEAIVLQQLHYLLRQSKTTYDGQPWVSLSYDDWETIHFPFWCARTVRRAILMLQKLKLITSTTRYNRHFLDDMKWYTINYSEVSQQVRSIKYDPNNMDCYNVRQKGQIVHPPLPETSSNSTIPDIAIMTLQKDKLSTGPDNLSTLRPDNLSTLRPDNLSTPYKEEEIKRLRDDNSEPVVVVSSAPPDPQPVPAVDTPDGELVALPRGATILVDTATTQVDAAPLVDLFRGTPLQSLVSPVAIRNAIAAYTPNSHPDCQPETPLEGVRRLCSWMARIAANPDMPAIRNPAGFLVALARKGMDKPACIAMQESAAERRRKDMDESIRYSVVRQLQKEYPGVVVEDVLAEMADLQYPIPTETQMKTIRIKLEAAQVRAEAARLKALADCRALFAVGRNSNLVKGDSASTAHGRTA